MSLISDLDENKTTTIYSLYIYYNVNVAQLKERRYRICVVGNVTGSSPVLKHYLLSVPLSS